MSERDGSNTHAVMSEIFRAMNTPIKARHPRRSEFIPTGDVGLKPDLPLRSWADQFPYVNGGLFSGSTEVPRFTRMARTYLLHTGGLNWKKINPDIFGSMIQAVADDEERGALGMHYTSVPNILKVLNPLFLDDLRAQLNEAGDNELRTSKPPPVLAPLGASPRSKTTAKARSKAAGRYGRFKLQVQQGIESGDESPAQRERRSPLLGIPHRVYARLRFSGGGC